MQKYCILTTIFGGLNMLCLIADLQVGRCELGMQFLSILSIFMLSISTKFATALQKECSSSKEQVGYCRRNRVITVKKGPTNHNFHFYYGPFASLRFGLNLWYWKDGTPLMLCTFGRRQMLLNKGKKIVLNPLWKNGNRLIASPK